MKLTQHKRYAVLLPFILLLASIASHAQTTATLYGRMDIAYGVSNGGDIEGRNGRDGKFQQWGNAYGSSRWGIKAAESLGNNLKAFIHLESGFNPESGESYGFNRGAYIGLSGNFGTLKAGRQDSLFDSILSDYSLSGDPTLTCATCNAGVSSGQRASRYNSALSYALPEWNGLTLQTQYVSKHDEAGIGNLAEKDIFSVGASYNWQNLTVSTVYESKPVSLNDVDGSFGLGIQYKLSALTLAGGYTDNHYKEDGKGFYMGVSAPVSSWTLGGQIAYNTDAYSHLEEKKIKPLAWQLFSFYHLSQRTNLYFMYGGIDKDAQDFTHALRKYSVTAGITHRF